MGQNRARPQYRTRHSGTAKSSSQSGCLGTTTGDIFLRAYATTARFPDEEKLLRQSGATAVFNIYTEAGTGFANHVEVQNQA
jgi:hypothetical protein